MSVSDNRRNYFRLPFRIPLSADLKIINLIGDHEVRTIKISIHDLGIGGLKFRTNLDLPTTSENLLDIRTVLFNNQVKLLGTIVHQKFVNINEYEYGVKLSTNDMERTQLTQLVNNLSIRLRKADTLPGCSFQ